MLLVAGCGGDAQRLETAAVSGVVTLDDRPVPDAAVVFTPAQGWPARGVTDADGRYALTTYVDGDGAIVGRHEIVVVAQSGGDEQEHFERPPQRAATWIVPERYANKTTSGLAADVQPGQHNDIDLTLYRDPRRAPPGNPPP